MNCSNGDFGTRGMPGTFKIFFVDVVLNMARAAEVLTIPMTVYVDDFYRSDGQRNDVENGAISGLGRRDLWRHVQTH